jgi:hypothetical protein
MDVETSSSSEKKPKRPMKKVVLVGLKPPVQMNMNIVDVNADIEDKKASDGTSY